MATILSLALVAGATQAQTARIPAEHFTRQSDYYEASISPTGEYVAVITPFEARHALTMIKLSGNYDRSMIKFGLYDESAVGAEWTDDSRLIVMRAKHYGSLAQPQRDGTVWAVNADGSDYKQIFGYVEDEGNRSSKLKDRGNVEYIANVPNSGGEALFAYYPWLDGNSKFITAQYRVNTHTGIRTRIEQVDDSVEIVADQSAKARLIWGEDMQGEPWLRYRPTEDSEWQPVPKSLAGRTMGVSAFEADNSHAYAWIADAGEPSAMYRVDFKSGTREKLASDPDANVSSYQLGGYNGVPFAAIYTNGAPRVVYFDPNSDWSRLHAGLSKIFPGQLVSFVNFTKDNNKILFHVSSDRNPGAYYVFDRTTHKPTLLFQTREWIDPATQAPTRPIQFKNAAGKTLFGYYTAPVGKTGPQALVVIPHGGPFGVRDTWGYDSDVQFLANRGYAVLQVNYRGSGGRGEDFVRSTYQQWGLGIQDDIADGVRWAISEKLADAGKVCIYGASFGGYSALMNPIRNPGMFKCAIGYAGVYDLAAIFGEDYQSKQEKAYFTRTVGTDEAKLAAQSPARLAAQIDVPVMLVHGKADHTAPYSQYLSMKTALDKAGKPFESLVKSDEGHGFSQPKNQLELYNKMEAFLLKYNPPN